MYSRLRTSLKQRTHGQRRTHRQRGGAAWYQIPAERASDWDEPLKALGFNFIVGGDRNKESTRNKETYMNEYFMILEKQDELFDAALKIISKKLGLETITSEAIASKASEIDSKREDMLKYVDDVEQLINFALDININKQLGSTKLQQIRTGTDETLSTLLLFPKRLNNVFIQSLANILISLKSNDTFMKQSFLNDEMKHVASVQLRANVEGNALIQTAKSLRDGFFLNQGQTDFIKTINGNNNKFWYELLNQLQIIQSGPIPFELSTDTAASKPCKINLKKATWAQITAHVFLAYISDKLPRILEFFKETCETNILSSQIPRTFIPDPPFDDVTVREVTYKSLLSHMDDTTLQFILHLSYTIQKNEPSVLGELNTPPQSL